MPINPMGLEPTVEKVSETEFNIVKKSKTTLNELYSKRDMLIDQKNRFLATEIAEIQEYIDQAENQGIKVAVEEEKIA